MYTGAYISRIRDRIEILGLRRLHGRLGEAVGIESAFSTLRRWVGFSVWTYMKNICQRFISKQRKGIRLNNVWNQ